MPSLFTHSMRRVLGASFLVVTFILICLASPALGCYSGLLVIPTTDVVENGEYSFELQNDSSTPIRSDTTARFLNTELGVAKNLELGVDFDISANADERVIGNGKYTFTLGGKKKVPMAVGFSSMDSKFDSIPYAVIGPKLPFGRLFLGSTRSEGKSRWFAGVDHQVNKKTTVMADYTSGIENFWSVAANHQFTERFGVLAGVEVPNDDAGDMIYSVHLVFCGIAFKCKTKE